MWVLGPTCMLASITQLHRSLILNLPMKPKMSKVKKVPVLQTKGTVNIFLKLK